MKQIKDVMKLSGLSRRTLQFYDDCGLVKAHRTKENYRLYTDAELEKLWQVLLYKEMGFKLREIDNLQGRQRYLLEQRMGDIADEIENLSSIYDFIRQALEQGLPPLKAELDSEDEGLTYAELAKKLVRGK